MGDKRYYKDGSILDHHNPDKVLHREDGPAVESEDGRKCWFLDGKRHNENGPSITGLNGFTYWHINGKHHRLDGPAVICPNGDKYYYINDIYYDKKDWETHPEVIKYRFDKILAKELW